MLEKLLSQVLSILFPTIEKYKEVDYHMTSDYEIIPSIKSGTSWNDRLPGFYDRSIKYLFDFSDQVTAVIVFLVTFIEIK